MGKAMWVKRPSAAPCGGARWQADSVRCLGSPRGICVAQRTAIDVLWFHFEPFPSLELSCWESCPDG